MGDRTFQKFDRFSQEARIEAGVILRHLQQGESLVMPHLYRTNVMELSKKKRLEDKCWKIGSASEFLELSPEESSLIDIKLALILNLKERRQRLMTQAELAEKINSSQPRIAAENGDDSVSIELLIRAILATGATPQDIGQIIAQVG
ncbi:helix-turn-helix transcriptional regulator [Microcoleus sp. MOSTC5]|uniref:helix-turn-helix transcriptional regulator n=2 Tax=unclassified Microcoleus TaxID=2642155 RepID=UPI002FD34560